MSPLSPTPFRMPLVECMTLKSNLNIFHVVTIMVWVQRAISADEFAGKFDESRELPINSCVYYLTVDVEHFKMN